MWNNLITNYFKLKINFTVSTTEPGTRMISITKYKMIAVIGINKSENFFFLNAKNKQTPASKIKK